MNTLILDAETANFSLQHLLQQVERGSFEVRNAQGNVVAFVLSPADHEAWTYVEANLDLNQHRDEVQQALRRRGGATTAQLLEKASLLAAQKDDAAQ